jgi:hypothetical protein
MITADELRDIADVLDSYNKAFEVSVNSVTQLPDLKLEFVVEDTSLGRAVFSFGKEELVFVVNPDIERD